MRHRDDTGEPGDLRPRLARQLRRDRRSYYGLSQGGILGTTVMAYEPTITRAVLGVGAANYSTLLERSTDIRPLPVTEREVWGITTA